MTGRDVAIGFNRRAAADEDRLLELRLGLGAWLGGLALERHQAEDVMLAAYEAMANTVEHAYRNGPGDVEVRAALAGGILTVTVDGLGPLEAVRLLRPGPRAGPHPRARAGRRQRAAPPRRRHDGADDLAGAGRPRLSAPPGEASHAGPPPG